MKVAVLAAALLSLVVPAAMADDVPQLTGTWKGKGEGMMMNGGHSLGNEVTLVISEQKGRAFRGEITYPRQGQPVSEPIVGTIDSDGDRIVFVGDRGYHFADYDDGRIEDCYVSDANGMAVCTELTRQ